MGVRRLAGAGLITALLALGAAAAPATGDEALLPSGALTYTWHGDPTRGCAAAGVCGVAGELVIIPQHQADFFEGQIDFGFATATVRVRRTDAGSSGTCVDTDVWPANSFASLPVEVRPGGRATAMLPAGQGPNSGRCAGPLTGDLPTVLTGRRLPGRAPAFSFQDSLPFVAGPYSGTLSSTLAFRPDRRSGFSSSSSSSSGSSTGPGGPSHFILEEDVRLTYRVSAAAGTIGVNFAGEPDPFCAALDSCGTNGRLSLGLAAGHGLVTLDAGRVVKHAVGRAQALNDFKAGRLGIIPTGPATNQRFTVAEQLARPGAATCTDTSPIQPDAQLTLGPQFANGPSAVSHGPTLPALLTQDYDNDEFLRTHCPGPDGTDVFGQNAILARGTVTLTQLLRRRSVLTVAATGGFSGPGYIGYRAGSIRFVLSLVRIRTTTIGTFG